MAIVDHIERVLIDEAAIGRRLNEVAKEITDTMGSDSFLMISVLKGAVVLTADLLRRLPHPVDLEFIIAQSYHGTTESSGTVDILTELPNVSGRSVLLIDDILDTGRTLACLKKELLDRGAESVRTCVLLSKRKERSMEIEADYYGFEIGDEFVVGYGLDYRGFYRNLPFIGIMKEDQLVT